ncbi:fibronectin type III domain-containing protein [uncultured Aquimarina sp.]|uniref:fibronectin type III domain-containing protein n=1 Tax=uncultured Aquimarina sp. TaxID=575652 RepID=UPI00262E00DE|nr:fibronectin type III domain-containing protein [uncultured Aquimarina sp.]
MKKLLFILIALLQLKVALAQTFPVRVTPQAIPPYPTNLSGYANSGITNSPLRVQLVLSDVTASSREVRLAVAIEGNGINAISAPVVIGAPTLIVDGGIPLNLTISELAPYFEQQNLQGISSVQYNSPLPDGSYRFCFEVFDAFTGNRLSSKNCATIFLINNDPPFLNKPDNQAKISEQNPTNIIFQWTPRHINVPNVSYEFSIVEVWDPYIDPQAIFVASPPLHQEVTTNTSLLYGPIQPLLLAGKRYAWRVRAFATNNGEEISVFNNNGNSEIFWFDYQTSCELPSNIQVQDVSMTNATISWIGHPDHLDYTIKYREAGSDRWYSKTTPRDYVTIDEFKADTVYEYRVVGNCTQNSFGESPVDTFRTLSEELADYASCGIQPDPVDLSNQELLTELFVNDVFTAGDFPVYVKEVSGSTSFTGEGYISTPWLATVRIPVKFENIKINTEMKLVDGFVVTTYDPNWGSIVDGDVIIDTILGDDGDVQVIDVDVDITNIEIDENGDIIIITSDGPIPDTFDGGNDIIFVDNTGEEWHVDADGDVSKGEQAEGGSANSGNTDGVSGGGVNEITAAGITVTFNNTKGFYSFDTVPKNAGGSIANEYDKVPISGGGEYNIPYKAIAALPDHPTDFVTAEVAISTNDHSASDIIFKTKEGTKVQASWNRDSTTATLSLKKAFDFAKQQIIATVRPKDSTDKYKVAGAANLWHLANQDVATINVKLISVNGASLSGIGERINKIYNPAGVQFNVTSASPLTVSDTTLDVGDSSLLSQYTEGEKAWISQFKTLPGYQRDTYYLFVTDIPPSDSGTEGFMPLKRQFGFVFAGDDKGRTAAHELGHGVFGLEHPFKKYNTTGTTDLLMDSGSGVQLSHMDWEKMHAPGIQIYWFQDDEDGESVQNAITKYLSIDNNKWRDFCFLSPIGTAIRLDEASHLKFNEDGAVISFIQNETKYQGVYSEQNQKFLGYLSEEHIDLVRGGVVLTDSFLEEFNVKKYSNIKYAPVGQIIFTISKKKYQNTYLDCIIEASWNNPVLSNTYTGNAIPPFLPENVLTISREGNQCGDAETEGVLDGLGVNVFYAFENSIDDANRQELIDFSNHITNKLKDKTYAFYREEFKDKWTLNSFQQILGYLKENGIYSINKFNNHFPVETYARDAEIILSSIDLRDGIPEGYNQNTIDWVKYKINLEQIPYEYSLNDLESRYEIMNDVSVYKSYLTDIESEGYSEAISMKDGYDQYVARFGTDSAVFAWSAFAAKASKDVLMAYMTYRLIAQHGVQILNKLGQDAYKRFIAGALEEGLGNLIAHEILSPGESIPYSDFAEDMLLGGVKNIFDNKITDVILDCAIGLDQNQVSGMIMATSSEEFYNNLKLAGLQCAIPVALGQILPKIKLHQQTKYLSKNAFLFFKNKIKLGTTETVELMKKLISFEELFSGKSDFYKSSIEKLLAKESGVKAIDVIFKSEYDITRLTAKSVERLANVIEKFDLKTNDELSELSRILRETIDIPRMLIFMNKMSSSISEYKKIMSKIRSHEMFDQVVVTNGKSTRVRDFLNDTGLYDYFWKNEGNKYYFAKLEEKEGILIIWNKTDDIIIGSITNITKDVTVGYFEEKWKDE